MLDCNHYITHCAQVLIASTNLLKTELKICVGLTMDESMLNLSRSLYIIIVILRDTGFVICMIYVRKKEPMTFTIIKMLDITQGHTDIKTQLHLIVNI